MGKIFMKNVIFISVTYILGILLILGSASQRQYSPPSPTYTTPKVLYGYLISVVDANKKPIENARVEVKVTSYIDKVVDESVVNTVSGGKVEGKLLEEKYKTYSLRYKVSKEGYYSKNGFMFLRENDTVREEVILLRPIDYLSQVFLTSKEGTNLKTKILAFLDVILLQSILADSYVVPKSFDLVTFKGRRYLKMALMNTNVYNSLKLNKYTIGKILFDEAIRKILTPLNSHISDQSFYGYDIIITGHTKSFADKYAVSKSVEYRFLMPQSIVSRYKDKEVSGQKLLDESIILMDDERIELKLQ